MDEQKIEELNDLIKRTKESGDREKAA